MNLPRHLKSPIDTSVYNRMRKRNNSVITSEKIKDAVLDVTGINPEKNTSSRKREIVKSRQFYIYFIRKYLKLSQQQAGLMVGGKDHATIWHAETCVNTFRELEKDYAKMYDLIEAKIKP